MKYTHIIWDFNGTLLDDLELCRNSTNALLLARGKAPLPSLDEYRDVFGFPVREYYVRAGFDFQNESYEAVAHEWVELYAQGMGACRLFDGVPETLQFFSDAGCRQMILSATDRDMLHQQVVELGIAPFFFELLGLGDVYAHSKTELGVEWRKLHPEAKAVFIGDTVHDAETASAMGADCVLIEGGHQSRAQLEKTGMPILGSVRDLPEFLAE